MGQHRNATRGAYPADHLVHRGPEYRTGRWLAFAKVAIESLFHITHPALVDKEPCEVRPAGNGAVGVRQRRMEGAGDSEIFKARSQLPGPFVTALHLRLDRSANTRVPGIESQAHNVALTVLVTGAEFDAR